MTHLDRIGSFGSLLAALACPACFPIFATAGAALGLGVLQPFEGGVFVAFQFLVVLSLAGNVLAYRRCRALLPLLIGVAAPLAILFAVHVEWSQELLYTGLAGLVAAPILNAVATRPCMTGGTGEDQA